MNISRLSGGCGFIGECRNLAVCPMYDGKQCRLKRCELVRCLFNLLLSYLKVIVL